MVNKLVP